MKIEIIQDVMDKTFYLVIKNGIPIKITKKQAKEIEDQLKVV